MCLYRGMRQAGLEFTWQKNNFREVKTGFDSYQTALCILTHESIN